MSDNQNENNVTPILSITERVRAAARPKPAVEKEVKTLGNEKVYIRRLSALEADTYQTGMVGKDGKIDFAKFPGYRGKLVAMCLAVNAEGTDLPFKTEEVNKWDNEVLEELVVLCNEVNNLGKKQVDEAGNG